MLFNFNDDDIEIYRRQIIKPIEEQIKKLTKLAYSRNIFLVKRKKSYFKMIDDLQKLLLSAYKKLEIMLFNKE